MAYVGTNYHGNAWQEALDLLNWVFDMFSL